VSQACRNSRAHCVCDFQCRNVGAPQPPVTVIIAGSETFHASHAADAVRLAAADTVAQRTAELMGTSKSGAKIGMASNRGTAH
jgi:hypothetical protein